MRCSRCESEQFWSNGDRHLKCGDVVKSYRCKDCNRRFNERSGTPMYGLRTSAKEVATALRGRGEGLGLVTEMENFWSVVKILSQELTNFQDFQPLSIAAHR